MKNTNQSPSPKRKTANESLLYPFELQKWVNDVAIKLGYIRKGRGARSTAIRRMIEFCKANEKQFMEFRGG